MAKTTTRFDFSPVSWGPCGRSTLAWLCGRAHATGAPAFCASTVPHQLINRLAALPAICILVLDDYHLIGTLDIHQQLAFLLEHLPPQVHLVIAIRGDPPVPLAHLRARAQIVELRQADLSFTEEELVDFPRRVMGLDLSPGDIATPGRRTEGLDRRPTTGRKFAPDILGSHRYVLDYHQGRW